MENEEWLDIKDYEGYYQVSNLGRVKSLPREILDAGGVIRRRNGKLLTPRVTGNNYRQVSLCKNGVTRQFLLHRLVAEAFIPNSNNCAQVNHIDEDKANNSVSNLEWCTAKYNSHYSQTFKKAVAATSKKVVQCDLLGNVLNIWNSTQEASRATDVNQSLISRCCNGKRNKAGGYLWKFELGE